MKKIFKKDKKQKILFIVVTIMLITVCFISIFIFYNNKSNTKTVENKLTYIKIKINPEFLIGIDKNNIVKSFVAINKDANIYNVKEILNLKLEESLKKIVEISSNNGIDFNNREVSVSIMNKSNSNKDEANDLYKQIQTIFISINPNLVLKQEVLSNNEIQKYEEKLKDAVFVVIFKNWDKSVIDIQTIQYDTSAKAPADPLREGYKFIGWDKEFSKITSNIEIIAKYSINSYKVTFKNWDDTILDTQTVEYGTSAKEPSEPFRGGSNFIGWDKDFSYITKEITIYPKYNNMYSTIFFEGTYLIGSDISPGEYIIFADNYKLNKVPNSVAAYYLCPNILCISRLNAGDESLAISSDGFIENSIITVRSGEYLKIIRSYAVPFGEVTTLNALVHNTGFYKIGTHLNSGVYKLLSRGDREGTIKIFNDTRQKAIFEQGFYPRPGGETKGPIDLKNGQYIRLQFVQLIKYP